MTVDPVLDDLGRLVAAESPSSDPDALARCADLLADLLESRTGTAPTIGDGPTVTWTGGRGSTPAVLLLGHLDTVWPLGTLQRLPFTVADGRITGPGAFDMKGGLVLAVHTLGTLAARDALPPVRLVVTSDEEVGSMRSRARIEQEARRCGRVLVLEPCAAGGAVKTARKGVALGRLVVHGRASHSGLAPADGVNAAVGLGGLLARVEALGDADRGTTVTPTLLRGGSTINTVPARAEADLDVRFVDPSEPDRVRAGLERLRAGNGARVEASLEVNRPALTPAASAPLRDALESAAAACEQRVTTAMVGGASDGNLAAAAGAAVLDGLGPDGDGAHADHEHVLVAGLAGRLALLVELLPRVAAVSSPA